MKNKNSLRPFRQAFSVRRLAEKVVRYGSQVGRRGIYSALLLYYAFDRKDTPTWAKNIVRGALGYLISPIDFIPDLTPVIGYTDDVGILAFGLTIVASYVNEEVRLKARQRTNKWLGTPSNNDTYDSVDHDLKD